MASFPCEAAALAAAAVHSAEASRSMRAVADCMAAAAGLAARSQQCGPAVEGPEIELDIELGAPDPSPDSSSPSSALSSSSTMLEAFEVLCSFLTDFQDLIFQIVLSIFMGSPIYPSLSHISKESDPAFLLFFLMYCGAWILITTALLFMFFGKSKQERLGRIWTCHLIIMALCIGTVLLTYVLIPYQQRTSNINIAVWALLCSIISSHVTAWNLRVDASSLSWARSGHHPPSSLPLPPGAERRSV